MKKLIMFAYHGLRVKAMYSPGGFGKINVYLRGETHGRELQTAQYSDLSVRDALKQTLRWIAEQAHKHSHVVEEARATYHPVGIPYRDDEEREILLASYVHRLYDLPFEVTDEVMAEWGMMIENHLTRMEWGQAMEEWEAEVAEKARKEVLAEAAGRAFIDEDED